MITSKLSPKISQLTGKAISISNPVPVLTIFHTNMEVLCITLRRVDFIYIYLECTSNISVLESDPIQILAKDSRYQRSMGNRNMPTFADVQLVNKYYTCSSACNNTLTCQNNGYQNPANCSTCLCPGGFGGDDCSKVADPEYGASNCGGSLNATDSWQTLVGQVGESSTTIYPRQAACHWHINAPEGKKINIKVDYIRGPCSLGCFYGSTEIKLGNFTLTGVRLCCSSDVPSSSNLVTDGSLAVISAHSQLAVEKFSLQYKTSS